MSGKGLQGQVLKRANPKTIQDKFLVGYQGWFTCHGDGKPLYPNHHGWLHWFDKPIPDGGHPNTDLWPDLSEYSPSELYPAPGLQNKDGEQMFLFSSRNQKTVTRHFHWMALHGVDGAFLQRFAGQCDMEAGNATIRDLRDEVGDRVREAAEAEGRVFAIMYDVSGVHPDKIQRVLEQDWTHLLRDKCVLDSPNYLREKGSPVIALWGFGFNNRNHSPEVVRSIANFFRSSTPGGAYLMAGVPGHWRTSTSDSDRNPEFLRVWTEEFDALSPWTVGRYGNEEDAERWGNEKVKPDFDFLKQRGDEGKKRVDYIPVVLPGGSGYNLSRGKWGFNANKRNGGHFLWTQIYAARRAGVRIIYGAMWDEYDEGTAFMPVVSSSKELPVHPQFDFLALDADGHSLPSDWYMRIAGFTAEALRGERMLHETFPIKELQDYWATRPKYEEETIQEEQEEQLRQTQMAYQNWATNQRGASTDEVPPPPYSLEEEQGTQVPQEAIRPPQTSSASDARPIPPVATKPSLESSSGALVSSISSPSLLARTPSSRNSSPLPLPASTTVAHLANDLARQKLSQPCLEVFSGPQQPRAPESSAIHPSVIQMPSVETSLERPCTPPGPIPSVSPRLLASPAPVPSWSHYPGQQQFPRTMYGPASHPHVPPTGSRPSPTLQMRSSPTIAAEYDWDDANVQQNSHTFFPQVEQYCPTDGQRTPRATSNAPQGPYITTDNRVRPYVAPYPVQDYHQHQIAPAQPHSGGSHTPRPTPVPATSSSHIPPVFEIPRPEPQLGRGRGRGMGRGLGRGRGRA